MHLHCPALIATLLQLLELPGVEKMFPSDVLTRARHLLEQIPGGVGAYRCAALRRQGTAS